MIHLSAGLASTAGLLALLSVSVHAANAEKEPWQLAEETEVWEPVPSVVTAAPNQAPSDAIVLFDGKDLSAWESTKGGPAKWTVGKGEFTVAPQTGDIRTKADFCDVQLHIEWKTPTQFVNADGSVQTGQGRSNSGVFLQDRYEIQMLDSFNNPTYPNGQAASVYKQTIPLVNATRAPGEWQTYDIIYSAPVFDDAKKLTRPAYVTVLHNGVVVQNHTEIKGPTAWIGHPPYEAHGCAPLQLQDHGNNVSFRNIWVRKL